MTRFMSGSDIAASAGGLEVPGALGEMSNSAGDMSSILIYCM